MWRWCAARVPEHARDQVRVECQVAAGHLTIVERRVPWREDFGPEWTSFWASVEPCLGDGPSGGREGEWIIACRDVYHGATEAADEQSWEAHSSMPQPADIDCRLS